jgi:hypothetical protein
MNNLNLSFIKLFNSLIFLSYIFPLIIRSITKYIYIMVIISYDIICPIH